MCKIAIVRRCNTLEINLEKICNFYVIYFFHYFPLQPFKSVHRENKFREVLNNDPVTKIY